MQTHDNVVGEGYFRHALFHPLEGEAKKEAEGIRMRGYVLSSGQVLCERVQKMYHVCEEMLADLTFCRHTDHGTTTMLFSVPITALQIWKDNRWQFVPYKRGALVINLGECLEGG